VLRRTALATLVLTVLTIGPASAGVTSTVEPPTDLVDGQVVRLVVDGLPAQPGGTWVEIVQCRTPIVDRAADCAPYGPYRHVSPAGLLRTHVAVRARLLVDGGSHDCRTGGCAFRVAVDGGPTVAALVPLDFDPAGPAPDPPAITAMPTTGLVDGQHVTVAGVGLFPFDDLDLRLCPDGAVPADCFRVEAGAFSNEHGEFHSSISAWAVLRDRDGNETDCRVAACILRAEVKYGLPGPVEIPLTFDPGADLLHPVVQVLPHTDLGPRQSVTVRLAGFHDQPSPVAVRQCLGHPTPSPDLGRCDRHNAELIPLDESAVRVSTRRVIDTRHGEVDCSVRRCRIWVLRTLESPVLSSERLTYRPRH